MNDITRRRYIQDLISDFSCLNGTEFEKCVHPILETITGRKLLHRGVGLTGHPKKCTVDSLTDDNELIGEYSVDEKYFDNKIEKIKKDIKHAFTLSPKLKELFLFSNRECPPKLHSNLIERIGRLKRRKGRIIHLYDVVRLAEYIVDEVFVIDSLVEKISQYLPSINRLRNELALSHNIPRLEFPYFQRSILERNILERFDKHNIVVISGVSGVGKSVLAINHAQTNKDKYDITIWIDGKNLSVPEDLKCIDVLRLGAKENIIGILNRYNALLIIDSYDLDAQNLCSFIASNMSSSSKVIITSQIVPKEFPQTIPVEFFSEEETEEYIKISFSGEIDKDLIQLIHLKTSGHPLLLSLVLSSIDATNPNLEKLKSDFDSYPFFEDDQGVTLCNRIISNHVEALQFELQAIRWLDTDYIQSSLIEHIIGQNGIKKLKKRKFLQISSGDFIKIHDLIMASIKSYELELNFFGVIQDKFLNFFLTLERNKNYIFCKALYTHFKKIISLLDADRKPGPLLYLYIWGVSPLGFDETYIGGNNFLDKYSEYYIYKEFDYYEILSILEFFEAKYRSIKMNISYPMAINYAQDCLPAFDQILSAHNIPENLYISIKHHLSKFYIYANDTVKAIDGFSEIIKIKEDCYPAKLQLAKLVVRDQPDLAKELIYSIIYAFRENREAVPITVLIASFQELRKNQYRDVIDQILTENIDIFEEAIINSASIEFDLPYEALAGVGKSVAYNMPDVFLRIIEKMPIPSEFSITPQQTFKLGELFKTVGKIKLRTNETQAAIINFNQANCYFARVEKPSSYEILMIAENYLLMGDASMALKTFDLIPTEERNCFWFHKYAKALISEKRYEKALECINNSIKQAEKENSKFLSTFYDCRSDIRRELQDGEYQNDIKAAIACCDNEKFRNELNSKLIMK